MPRGPLADDWFFWDPETIFAYPHSREPATITEASWEHPEPVQLDFFNPPESPEVPE